MGPKGRKYEREDGREEAMEGQREAGRGGGKGGGGRWRIYGREVNDPQARGSRLSTNKMKWSSGKGKNDYYHGRECT